MLHHYLKVFFHNLLRQKVITLINIAGLAVGMAVFILISLYVTEEYSYEKRWEKADRVVRTTSKLQFNADATFEMGEGSSRELATFREFFPVEVEAGSRVWRTGQSIVVDQEESPGGVNHVDPEFLDIFNFEEVHGSLANTLAVPGRIALEEEYALSLFPGEALGRSLTLRLEGGTEQDFEVSAIYRLPEGKGQLEFTSLTLLEETLLPDFIGTESDWLSGETAATYYLLRESSAVANLNARTDELVEQYVRGPWMLGEDIPVTDRFSIRLQPIRDMYFEPLQDEEGGSRLTANSFALVAALVLLIAVTNFVILSVARSAERVSEVGIRKANGARRLQLQGQFLLEALLQVVLAFCVALAIYEVIEPLFESLMRTELLTRLFSVEYLLWGLLLIVVITVLGGMYPAFVLASASPERALKAGGGIVAGNTVLRKILVSFQFSISVGLIIATVVIYQQLFYIQNRDAGFDADNVVSMALFRNSGIEKSTALSNEISRIPGVDLVTPVSRVAGKMVGSLSVSSLRRERGSDVSVEIYQYNVGYDFFSLYGMEILAGRSFTRERDSLQDRSAYQAEEGVPFIRRTILNESSVKDFGFTSPQESIGQALYSSYRTENNEIMFTEYEVIGVVADSQFDSLRSRPDSEMYRLIGNSNEILSFRVEESAMDTVRAELENAWDEVIGISSPMIFFGRDLLAEAFNKEENEGRLLAGFTLLAILVSCLGLYGLVAFDTARRTKEIGVRKVLGGNHGNIQLLFLRQYFWPMLAANIVAWPITLWAMQQWLQKFPYQIQPWVLVPICIIAGLLVITIAGSTLGLTVWKALRTKPAQALRYE